MMKTVLKEFSIRKEKLKGSGGPITPDIVRASRENNFTLVKSALEQNPACINDQDPVTGMTALHWACANRNKEVFDLLGEFPNLSYDLLTFAGQSPEQLALESGATEIADALHQRIFVQDHLDEDPYADNSSVSIFSPKDP
jgi:ankyrin repeat protein